VMAMDIYDDEQVAKKRELTKRTSP
jgi:hypothetical protein